MKLEFTTNRSLYRINEPVRVAIRALNDGVDVLRVSPELVECHYLVNDKDEDYFGPRSSPNPPIVEIPAGSAANIETAETSFQLSLHTLYAERPTLEPFTFQLQLTLIVDSRREKHESPRFPLEIDFRDTTRILTSEGGPTDYVVDGRRVIYISPYGRAVEGSSRVLPADPERVRVLDEHYLVDDKHVYRSGRAQKGVGPEGFRVLNPVFAKNDDVVLTSYGNAKVEHPPTFEALDDGTNSVFYDPAEANGYRASYGRDRALVYYFDESTSTPHAIRVRACKNPGAFQALTFGYGRDDKNVYLEGRRVEGADPRTWTQPEHETFGEQMRRATGRSANS